MDLKQQIDSMNPMELYKFIKSGKCHANDTIETDDGRIIPLLFYLMQLDCPVKTLQYLINKTTVASIKTELDRSSIEWPEWLKTANTNYIALLASNQLTQDLPDETVQRLLVELLIKADVPRILTLHKHKIVRREAILDALRTPQLVITALNYLYYKVGQLCRLYQLKSDEGLLIKVCQLEKRYVTFLRLIASNGIELRELVDVSEMTQMIFNSYLYRLIEYVVDTVDHSTLLNVIFYHYSNFPIENKVILSPIYNDGNFERIESLLREKMFIKKIIKKKLGKRTFRCPNYLSIIDDRYQIEIGDISAEHPPEPVALAEQCEAVN